MPELAYGIEHAVTLRKRDALAAEIMREPEWEVEVDGLVIGGGFANEIHVAVIEGRCHADKLLGGGLAGEPKLRRDESGVGVAEECVTNTNTVLDLAIELG